MNILGIETSCDETSVAIVNDRKKILSHIILSQIKQHQPYGGVVPEIAARSHLDNIDRLVVRCLRTAKLKFREIDGIAATAGPGLIGGLIVGTGVAKAISVALKKPFFPINHLEGHVLSIRLFEECKFPFLALLVSGGHCQILIAKNIGDYELLGTTYDDAIGETFDKVAKMLDMKYPGGPEIEKKARNGNPKKFNLPKPLINKKNCDFSFSGLKTATNKLCKRMKLEKKMKKNVKDICASFQETVCEVIVDRCRNAIKIFNKRFPSKEIGLVIVGGVASNNYLRSKLSFLAKEINFSFIAPPKELCTDNAAMIAWAAIERIKIGMKGDINFKPTPRWQLNVSNSSKRISNKR